MNIILNRMMFYLRLAICFAFSICMTLVSCAKNQIVLKDIGILEAKNGVARYEMLYKAHQLAIAEGKKISYAGIDTLFLEIPKNAKSIELSRDQDFCNVVFVVENNAKDIFLFSLSGKHSPIKVSKPDIDDGRFYKSELKRGSWILIIKDEKPWSDRIGYGYSAYRKDAILIKRGKAKITPCSPYNNEESDPSCEYFKAEMNKTVIKNLHLVRDESCSKKTYLINVAYKNNVLLQNLSVVTPESKLYGDGAIWIENCADVNLNNITIDGTYSLDNQYGYGIRLENVTGFIGDKIVGKAKWGVFGNNNVNTPTLINCDINRFDIHCYGKDVTIRDCTIRDLYNQFSCVFGSILYERCHFIDATPYVDGASYNTNVKNKFLMIDCTVYASPSKNSLINIHHISSNLHERENLRDKYLPDVEIKNLTINASSNVNQVFLYKIGALDYKDELLGGESSVKEIHFIGNDKVEFKQSNRQIKIKKK